MYHCIHKKRVVEEPPHLCLFKLLFFFSPPRRYITALQIPTYIPTYHIISYIYITIHTNNRRGEGFACMVCMYYHSWPNIYYPYCMYMPLTKPNIPNPTWSVFFLMHSSFKLMSKGSCIQKIFSYVQIHRNNQSHRLLIENPHHYSCGAPPYSLLTTYIHIFISTKPLAPTPQKKNLGSKLPNISRDRVYFSFCMYAYMDGAGRSFCCVILFV